MYAVTKAQARTIPRFTCITCTNGNNPAYDPSNERNADNEAHPEFDILQHLKTCKSSISLIGNIPRGSRIAAAEAMNELITEAIRSNSSLSWAKLLSFTYHALQKPKKEKKRTR